MRWFAGYLNLDERPDRREHMERTLEAVGIEAQRFQGGLVPWQYAVDNSRLQKMFSLTPATIGCWFGQVRIMQEALRQGEHALVMEDDIVFCSDFDQRLSIIERFLDGRPWDVFWLGGTYHVNPPVCHKDDLGRDAQLTENSRIIRTYGCFSTYAYVVNVDSIAKILAMLEDHMPQSIGIDTSFIHLEPELLTYAFLPGMVKQFDNVSSITGVFSPFSGFARLGPYWWQDKMEDFDPMTFDWAEAR